MQSNHKSKCGRGGRKVHIRVTVHEKIIPTTVDFENNREVWARESRQPGEVGTYKGSDVSKTFRKTHP